MRETEVQFPDGEPTHPLGFPCGSAGKEPLAMWETWVQSLDWVDPLEKERYLQYSGLENSRDCIVHGVAKSQTRLEGLSLTHSLKQCHLNGTEGGPL